MMYSRINWEVIINQEMIIYQRKRGKLIMSKAELAIKRSTMESVTVHRLLHVVLQKKPG